MNRKVGWMAMMGILATCFGCSAEKPAEPVRSTEGGADVLVAYFSRSGNTRRIAERIQKKVGGTLFEIKPEKAYPPKYGDVVKQARKECKEGFKPALSTIVPDMSKYRVVFIGSPNWWGTVAPPVATFLTSYDFRGMTVIPFFTNGGGGMQNCERDVRNYAAGASFQKGITFEESQTTGFDEWLDQVFEIVPLGKDIPQVLTMTERAVVTASALAAKGEIQLLQAAVSEGVSRGVPFDVYREIFVQLYAYCGFPRSLNALAVLMNLAKERGWTPPKEDISKVVPSDVALGTVNQTKLCGRSVSGPLFDFAPPIDLFLKTHLFGDIFRREQLDWRMREIATVAMLEAMGDVPAQRDAHIQIAKQNRVTDAQLREILGLARDVARGEAMTSPFPLGNPNTAYEKYFSGRSWLSSVAGDQRLGLPVHNVTFEPGCRNHWHAHTGGQLLIAVGGVGYYQERGKTARRLVPGNVVEIPPNVEHWHGAAPESWFAHLAMEGHPGENRNSWLEPVSDADYRAATKEVQ